LDQKALGKFILWAVIALVGWSFYSTLKHETAIAVIHRQLEHLEEKIQLNQQHNDIDEKISTLAK
jgi:prefoldin subunit 5